MTRTRAAVRRRRPRSVRRSPRRRSAVQRCRPRCPPGFRGSAAARRGSAGTGGDRVGEPRASVAPPAALPRGRPRATIAFASHAPALARAARAARSCGRACRGTSTLDSSVPRRSAKIAASSPGSSRATCVEVAQHVADRDQAVLDVVVHLARHVAHRSAALRLAQPRGAARSRVGHGAEHAGQRADLVRPVAWRSSGPAGRGRSRRSCAARAVSGRLSARQPAGQRQRERDRGAERARNQRSRPRCSAASVRGRARHDHAARGDRRRRRRAAQERPDRGRASQLCPRPPATGRALPGVADRDGQLGISSEPRRRRTSIATPPTSDREAPVATGTDSRRASTTTAVSAVRARTSTGRVRGAARTGQLGLHPIVLVPEVARAQDAAGAVLDLQQVESRSAHRADGQSQDGAAGRASPLDHRQAKPLSRRSSAANEARRAATASLSRERLVAAARHRRLAASKVFVAEPAGHLPAHAVSQQSQRHQGGRRARGKPRAEAHGATSTRSVPSHSAHQRRRPAPKHGLRRGSRSGEPPGRVGPRGRIRRQGTRARRGHGDDVRRAAPVAQRKRQTVRRVARGPSPRARRPARRAARRDPARRIGQRIDDDAAPGGAERACGAAGHAARGIPPTGASVGARLDLHGVARELRPKADVSEGMPMSGGARPGSRSR